MKEELEKRVSEGEVYRSEGGVKGGKEGRK